MLNLSGFASGRGKAPITLPNGHWCEQLWTPRKGSSCDYTFHLGHTSNMLANSRPHIPSATLLILPFYFWMSDLCTQQLANPAYSTSKHLKGEKEDLSASKFIDHTTYRSLRAVVKTHKSPEELVRILGVTKNWRQRRHLYKTST